MTDSDAAPAPTHPALPYRYEKDTHVEKLVEDFGDLEPGTETETVVSIAGRLMLRRVQGKLAFGTLQDSTGRIQLFAPSKTTRPPSV